MSRLQPGSVNRIHSKRLPVKEIRPAGLRWRLILGVIFILASIIFAGWQIEESSNHETKLAALNGPATPNTTATITKKEITRAKNSGDTCHVAYQFQLAGNSQPYNHEGVVNCASYQNLKEGDSIFIRYLPQEPTFSRLEDEPKDDLDFNAFEIRIGVAALTAFFTVYYLLWTVYLAIRTKKRRP